MMIGYAGTQLPLSGISTAAQAGARYLNGIEPAGTRSLIMHKLFRKMALKEFGTVFLDTADHMVFVFEAEWNATNFIHQIKENFILDHPEHAHITSYDYKKTTVLLNMMEIKDK
jgi:hypothetical protein